MYDNEQSIITYGGLKELIEDLLLRNITEDDLMEDGKISNDKLDDVLKRYED